jgi:hypothetical protein
MKSIVVGDVQYLRLRLTCKCGTSVSVEPASLEVTIFQCPSCAYPWPERARPAGMADGRLPHGAEEWLAVALRDLQQKPLTDGYRVEFEFVHAPTRNVN